MIERADSDYLARMFVKAPAGFWHLHTRGYEPFMPESLALEVAIAPEVHQGRWVVQCPFCAGAQLGAPEMDRFLCVDCANVAVGGQWVRVVWPEPSDVEAIEAALLARPAVDTRNWLAGETVGSLLFQNLEHDLVDHDGGRVMGDIGADQLKALFPRPELTA